MATFDPRLICAEENALLAGMSANGAAMYYDPLLVVYHERRPDLRSLIAQMVKYGRGRGQAIRRHPGTFRVPYAVPALLVAYLVLLAPLLIGFGPIAAVPLAMYLAVLVGGGAKVASTLRRPRAVLLAVPLLAAVHLAYGAGLWRGLADRRRRRPPERTWAAPTGGSAIRHS
jgi:hypothetical protein